MDIVNRQGDEVTHVHIRTEEDGFTVEGAETFASLRELIETYANGLDELREKTGHVIRLVRPVDCNDPTNERLVQQFYKS